jgi:glycosyltransferase involved in cell wall biosynthesis
MNATAAQPQPRPAPLRISYLLSQFPVRTEVFAISDILALRAAGHEVVVHTVKPRPAKAGELLEICGVPADLRIMRPSWSGAWKWPGIAWRHRRAALSLLWSTLAGLRSSPVQAFLSLLCIPRALEIVDETRIAGSDVVHVFWARQASMVLQALANEGAQPVRTSFVGAYDLVADDFLVTMAVGSAQAIFTHAEANRPFVAERAPPGIPVVVVQRGIPLPEVEEDGERNRFRWITASALVEPKNVDGVIRAFSTARAREARLTLDIYGDGPDRGRLEGLARQAGCGDSVRFGGHVSRDSLFRHLANAGAFLLLSKKSSERLPNVVKEAMWAGCAVLSSNSIGIEELIPDRSYGWVVDHDNDRSLAEAISGVLDESEQQAASRRARARALIAERFSSNRSMGRYADVWTGLRTGSIEQRASP